MLRQTVITRNEARLQAGRWVNNIFNPVRPCGVKLDAWYRRQNVNAYRRAAHVKEGSRLCEVGGGQTFKRCAELRQGCEKRLRVLRVE